MESTPIIPGYLWVGVAAAVGGIFVLLYLFSTRTDDKDKHGKKNKGGKKPQQNKAKAGGSGKKKSTGKQEKSTTQQAKPKKESTRTTETAKPKEEEPEPKKEVQQDEEELEKKKREAEKRKQKKQRRKTLQKEQQSEKQHKQAQAGSGSKQQQEKTLQKADKTASTDSLSDFEKIEDIGDGWEVVPKKAKKSKVKKEEEQPQTETQDEAAVAEKKTEAKSEKKQNKRNNNNNRELRNENKERRRDNNKEGGGRNREGRDKERGNQNRDERKRKSKAGATKESPRSGAKPRRQWKEGDMQVNGILFSKFNLDQPQDEQFDTEKEKWDHLAALIKKGSSISDDVAPFPTAFLEMRFYRRLPSKEKANKAESRSKPDSGSAAWDELAKYNYTQASPVRSSEGKDKGKEHVAGDDRVLFGGEHEDEFTSSAPSSGLNTSLHNNSSEEDHPDRPDANTAALIESFIKSLGPPYVSHVQKPSTSVSGTAQRFLIKVDVEDMRPRLHQLLTSGIATEPPVFPSANPEAASSFITELFDALSSDFTCYTNWEIEGHGRTGAGFWQKPLLGAEDEGFLIVSPDKVVMLWFLGYD